MMGSSSSIQSLSNHVGFGQGQRSEDMPGDLVIVLLISSTEWKDNSFEPPKVDERLFELSPGCSQNLMQIVSELCILNSREGIY